VIRERRLVPANGALSQPKIALNAGLRIVGGSATPRQPPRLATGWKRRAGTPGREDWARRRMRSSREPATPSGDRSDSPRGGGSDPADLTVVKRG